jgi:hypothetical protein
MRICSPTKAYLPPTLTKACIALYTKCYTTLMSGVNLLPVSTNIKLVGKPKLVSLLVSEPKSVQQVYEPITSSRPNHQGVTS